MLALFAFPRTAQHIPAHAAFKITQVTEPIIPTDWQHACAAICISGLPNAVVLMFEHCPEIAAVNISVQQFAVAHVTF